MMTEELDMTATIETTTDAKPASMLAVHKFLGDGDKEKYPLAQFRKDWEQLSDEDKMQLRTGIGNGTLTY